MRQLSRVYFIVPSCFAHRLFEQVILDHMGEAIGRQRPSQGARAFHTLAWRVRLEPSLHSAGARRVLTGTLTRRSTPAGAWGGALQGSQREDAEFKPES